MLGPFLRFLDDIGYLAIDLLYCLQELRELHSSGPSGLGSISVQFREVGHLSDFVVCLPEGAFVASQVLVRNKSSVPVADLALNFVTLHKSVVWNEIANVLLAKSV